MNFPDEWLRFQSSDGKTADVLIEFCIDNEDSLNKSNGIYYYLNTPCLLVDRHTSDYLIADEQWRSLSLHVSKLGPAQLKKLCFMAARSAMLFKHALFIHGALVNLAGCAVLFSGPSGIGKSTQADLWAKVKGANIINGDVSLVQKTGDRFFGYGSPWHGNSPHCESGGVPLRAIVVLEQSMENRITRLNGIRMINQVLNNVFVPQWVPECNMLLLDILNELLKQVPVYLLSNKADDESVHIVAQELFSEDLDEHF